MLWAGHHGCGESCWHTGPVPGIAGCCTPFPVKQRGERVLLVWGNSVIVRSPQRHLVDVWRVEIVEAGRGKSGLPSLMVFCMLPGCHRPRIRKVRILYLYTCSASVTQSIDEIGSTWQPSNWYFQKKVCNSSPHKFSFMNEFLQEIKWINQKEIKRTWFERRWDIYPS